MALRALIRSLTGMRRVSVVFACLVGCTVANPSYIGNNGNPPVGGNGSGGAGGVGIGGAGGGGGGAGGSGGVGGGNSDMSMPVVHDMAMHEPDLAHPGECGPGERQCTNTPSPSSESCQSNMFVLDRRCPFASLAFNGATCNGGYCRPPTGQTMLPCGTAGGDGDDFICAQQGNGTRALSCQPFVSNPAKGTVEWFCAVAVTNARGSAGDPCTSGAECRTGFCGSNGTCFVACTNDNECPGPIGCGNVKITVEGVTVSTQSCVP
jgi:hypothetical protein